MALNHSVFFYHCTDQGIIWIMCFETNIIHYWTTNAVLNKIFKSIKNISRSNCKKNDGTIYQTLVLKAVKSKNFVELSNKLYQIWLYQNKKKYLD